MFKFIQEYMNNYVVFEFLKSIPGFEMLRQRKKLNFSLGYGSSAGKSAPY